MYCIYEIINIETNMPVYIGLTKNLQTRIYGHFDHPGGVMYAYRENWRSKFKVSILRDDIESRNKAEQLEYKYIQDYISRGYKLLNTSKTKQKTDNIYGRGRKIICINTQEIYSSKRSIMRKFNVSDRLITRACKYGTPCGIDENENELYWKYFDKVYDAYEQLPNNNYKVYVIEYCQDNVWTPIYVGSTKRKLQDRLAAHFKYPTNENMKRIFAANDKSKFRIILIKDKINKEDIFHDEEKYTLQYQKSYKLFNISIGNKANANILKNNSNKMKLFWNTNQGKKIRNEYKNNGKHFETKIICINDNLVFDSFNAAAAYYNINAHKISEAVRKHTICNGLQFEYVDKTLYDKYKVVYYIFLVYKDNVPIFFSCKKLTCNSKVSAKTVLRHTKYMHIANENNLSVRILATADDKQKIINKLKELYQQYNEFTTLPLETMIYNIQKTNDYLHK